MSQTDFREINYLCPVCKQKRSFIINEKSHKQRKYLKQLGVTSYYDIHFSVEDGLHGIEITLDQNFNIRDRKPMGLLVSASPLPLPTPDLQLKKVEVGEGWRSWSYLRLKHETKMFYVEYGTPSNPKHVPSPFGTVVIEFDPTFEGFHEKWFGLLAELLEYTSKFIVENLEEILRYIDSNVDHPLGIEEEETLRLFLDLEATIITDFETLNAGIERINRDDFDDKETLNKCFGFLKEHFSRDVILPLTIETFQKSLNVPITVLSKILLVLFMAQAIKIVHTYSLPEL